METKSKGSRGHHSGQILVLVTLILPVLIGAMALGTDVAVLYFNWHLLQSAADDAALAGASYLPEYPSLAVSSATSYAERNGIASGEISSLTVSSDDKSLTIDLARYVPYRFGVLLGLFSGRVTAHATAAVQAVGSVIGIRPFGIDYRTSYTSGQLVTLDEGMVGPGNWDPLALGGTGSATMLNNIEYGYQGQISAGGQVLTNPGMATGPISTGFQYLLDEGMTEDPSGTFSDHTFNDPRVVIVPMVNFSAVNGSSEVPVEGFAALWLVGLGSANQVETYFISQVAPDSTPSTTAGNFGAYRAVLTD